MSWFNYFQQRAELAERHCDFGCDPGCSRPGCQQSCMHIPVTILDIIGAARHSGATVTEVYRKACQVGLMPHSGTHWVMRVALKLRKPCFWLRDDRCRVYPVRPIACALFPEWMIAEGGREILATREEYADYRCLNRESAVRSERAAMLRRLRGWLERELTVSDSLLFGTVPFTIDFTTCEQEILQLARTLGTEGRSGGDCSSCSVPFSAFEACFAEIRRLCPPFTRLEERIENLDEPSEQERVLVLLSDSRAIGKMQGRSDPSRVFQPVAGELKPARRRPGVSETYFL